MLGSVRPPGVEPGTNGLCLPATAFAAPFRFVVWTVSCLYGSPVQSLHLPLARLGSGSPRLRRGFPEFERFYQRAESTYPKATHLFSTLPTGLGTAYQLQLSLPLSGLWSGLSLAFTARPYSLYTFLLRGLARDHHAYAEASPNLSDSTKGQSQLTPRQPICSVPCQQG